MKDVQDLNAAVVYLVKKWYILMQLWVGQTPVPSGPGRQ